jgi:hypothetical protein
MPSSSEARVISASIRRSDTIFHRGNLVVKSFVPDDVYITAEGGSITLEKGGGNNVRLLAGGDVTVTGPLGNSFYADTKGSVKLATAGNEPVVYAGGSFDADALGDEAVIRAGGPAHIGPFGESSDIRENVPSAPANAPVLRL